MITLQDWLATIKTWYNADDPQNISELTTIIGKAPAAVFEYLDNDIGSEAFAHWLDGCQRICAYQQQQQQIDLAFSYLQLPYAKLQTLICDPKQSPEIQRWALKKTDQMIITLLEFCQHQQNSKQYWQQQSIELINLHAKFMEAQHHLNLKYSRLPSSS